MERKQQWREGVRNKGEMGWALNLVPFVETQRPPVNSTCLFPKDIPGYTLVLLWRSEPWKTLNLSMWMKRHRPLWFSLVNRSWRLLECERSHYYRALQVPLSRSHTHTHTHTHTHAQKTCLWAHFLSHWSNWIKQILKNQHSRTSQP